MDANTLLQQITSLTSSETYLIAYSGGLDSHVLLHLMAEISQFTDFKIRAIHVNHGLQNKADDWADHCQKICHKLKVSCQSVTIDLPTDTGESIEALARNARYQVLRDSLQANEVMLTGHHLNDQAETLLLQLFRGAGVDGLASMPIVTDFGRGQHLRPLLNVDREALEVYASNHALDYIEDPSNRDERFDRNFLRHNIIPQLQSRWLGINTVLSRVARIQAETSGLLNEYAAQELEKIQGIDKDSLSITGLLNLSEARKKMVLRYWIKQQGFSAPSSKKIQHLCKDVLNSRNDAMPVLGWQGAELRRYQDKLYIMRPLSEHDHSQVLSWDLSQPLSIPGLEIVMRPEALSLVLQDLNEPITVRFRQGGEKVYMPERGLNVSLKNLFQEVGIPPWQRTRIPLVYSGELLVHVFGIT